MSTTATLWSASSTEARVSMRLDGQDHTSSLDQAAVTFVEVRPRLFGIAYRMLASSAEAEDIVQETWLRWQNTERSAIANPAAFLALITTRLSVNATQSARARRETYIAPWLPEPVDTSTDPAVGAERGEALELALLRLLEKLTPAQRAAYILREAFAYPYERIAKIIKLSPANVRQLVSRARKHLNTTRRESIDTDQHRRLLSAFLDAAQKGNLTALEDLFAADVVSSSDGDGSRGAALLPQISNRAHRRHLSSRAAGGRPSHGAGDGPAGADRRIRAPQVEKRAESVLHRASRRSLGINHGEVLHLG